MRFLVLGGTAPLGHAVAATARDAGHDVSCLARGTSGPALDGVRLVPADRTAPRAYQGVLDEWDAVLDVSWQPGQVRLALAAIGDRTAHWTYVSSCSVYAAHDEPGADETAALLPPLAEDVDTAAEDEYGEAKVACESACSAALGDRLHVSRAGLLGGPGDRSDRAGYWAGRFARGGDVLVPEGAGQSAQLLDLRDYAAFLVGAAERRAVGTLNAVGDVMPLRAAIDLARDAVRESAPDAAAGPVVVDDAWLVDQGVEPWMGPDSLPLWLPDPAYAGFAARSDASAVAAGLRRRPLALTFASMLVDERTRGLDRPRRAGLSSAREGELLRAWRIRRA